jgi:nucleoside-diphosphate-sugar epimerase
MRARTLVTGATGFIGTYLVRQLLADGVPTRVLVRRPALLPADVRSRVQMVRGDLRDPTALRAAVPGTDTVLHLAACARAWSRDPTEFIAVNVAAVEALLDAACAAGVERLVHVSTILTLPPRRPAGLDGIASRPTAYEASKRAGERLVESYAAAGRHAVIVHPTRVYGPGPCNDANAVTRVIALYLRGRFRVRLDDGDVLGSYAHAADVADGIRRAACTGRSGAHYVLGGENLSFRAFLALVGEVSGVSRRVVALPRPAALAAAYLGLLWGRLGGVPPITPGWIRVFLEDRPADIGPARRDLGYAPRPARVGVADTIAWLQRGGGESWRLAA